MILIIGAIFGFISVAFGAYAEHGLKTTISSEHFEMLTTAVHYNQLYAIIITIIGLTLLNNGKLADSITLKISGFLFIIGTFFFSFGIYIAVIFKLQQIISLVPIGGTILMLGWISLALVGILRKYSYK